MRRLFLVSAVILSAVLIHLPSGLCASERGIRVQARTHAGGQTEIRLYEGYHALVIGASDYRSGWPWLASPVKDAREVEGILKEMGWTVEVVENPDGARLRRALNSLTVGAGRSREKAILVWFSGTVIPFPRRTARGSGTWCPWMPRTRTKTLWGSWSVR